MMKQPTKGDFTVVDILESGVTVLFKPTQSYYTFYRLADPNDIKRFGPRHRSQIMFASTNTVSSENRRS